jgi:hypothetical protein
MSRWWNEHVAAMTDVIPLPLLVFGLVLLAITVGVLWFFWPAWLPRRWPRLRRRPRGRLERQRVATAVLELADEPAEAAEPDALPDLPAEAFASLADRFAAEGRFAEAVRERLRFIVRDLVDHDVIEHHPGWTVSELARAAARAQPALGAALAEATTIFSDVWYGMIPARIEQDQRMRALVTTVHAVLEAVPVAPGGGR